MARIRFHELLRAKAMEQYDAESNRILDGYPDYAVYREQVGFLRGIKLMLQLADEVEKGMT